MKAREFIRKNFRTDLELNMGGSGYRKTAEMVLKDANLEGKWFIITGLHNEINLLTISYLPSTIMTGASSGIGLETARVLYMHHANVVMVCRNKEKMAEAANKIKQLVTESKGSLVEMQCDLCSLKSVNDFCDQYKSLNHPLHALILNAGVWSTRLVHTEGGFEQSMMVNHLAGFAMTLNLLDVMKKSNQPTRIIVLTSTLHQKGWLNWNDIHWEKQSYNGFATYCASKLASLYFCLELSYKLKKAGITAGQIKIRAVHPGLIDTVRHGLIDS